MGAGKIFREYSVKHGANIKQLQPGNRSAHTNTHTSHGETQTDMSENKQLTESCRDLIFEEQSREPSASH